MKYIKTVAAVAMVALAAGGYAVARSFHGAGAGQRNVTAMVAHLGEMFPKFAAFDVNKNGQLEGTERESLAKAIADGSLGLPPNMPPKDKFPTAEAQLDHMLEMYGRIAAYDANHDGALDSNEQGALQSAIQDGELSFLKDHSSGTGHGAHQLGKLLHAH